MTKRRFESDRRYNGLAFAFIAYQGVVSMFFVLLLSTSDAEDPGRQEHFSVIAGVWISLLGLALAVLPLVLKRSRAGAIACIVYAGLILLFLAERLVVQLLTYSVFSFISLISLAVMGSGPVAILLLALRALPAAESLGEPSIPLVLCVFVGVMVLMAGVMMVFAGASSP